VDHLGKLREGHTDDGTAKMRHAIAQHPTTASSVHVKPRRHIAP
jgi:hypothetical protein